MKNILLILFLAALCPACSKSRAYFSESGYYYQQNADYAAEAPRLRKYDEGIYIFSICVKDTLVEETKVQWFCDCENAENAGIVDQVGMAFLDEGRVILFKNPTPNRELDLRKPGKQVKLGLYTWHTTHTDDLMLSIRVRSPKTEDSDKDFSDLYFQVKGNDLNFEKMTYSKSDGTTVNMVSLAKRIPSPHSTNKSKTPRDNQFEIKRSEFAFTKMPFKFVPQPLKLLFDAQPVQNITLSPVQNAQFTRTTTYLDKNSAALQLIEISSDSLSIKTW